MHALLQQAYPPDKREPFSAEAAISQKLTFEAGSPDQERKAFFGTLRFAWDALTYEGFAAGSHAELLSGAVLNQVYNHNRVQEAPEPGVIHLTDPVQVRMLDAMAEAAAVPHTPGQAAIAIPKATHNYTDTLLSVEYQARVKSAAARARGEAPPESWLAPAATPQRHKGQSGERAGGTVAEQDPIYEAFLERLVDEASTVPALEDPAFWPRRVFEKVEGDIVNRDFLTDPAPAALARKLAPLAESIRRVRLAYEISAYPAIKKRSWEEKSPWQELIEADLKRDQTLNNRNSVQLSPAEQDLVRRLCQTPRYSVSTDGRRTLEPQIPFDPNQLTYRFAVVLQPPTGGKPETA